MIYQGEEDPALYGGKGEPIVDFLAAVIACRKRLPALARGGADYQAVRASDGVFACLRSSGGEKAVVLVGFNQDPVTTRLTLPPDLRSVRGWKDELTGEQPDASKVPMAGHQVRVLKSLSE
jgi:glycosidase